MDTTDKYIGRFLDNRYEILEKIGTGGMAVVYKARCHRLNRIVAIKILKDELAGDADFRRRFRTESQAVAMLSHPNIVAVYDVCRSGDVEYIVMEYIDGITLKQYITRKGVLNWKEALHFASQVAKALAHAHSRGIIHRDIKPHNIMIVKDGSVKVADFGIARLQSTQNTLTQEALGSVHYISPEQAKGGHVDARSDIYSLGVVMYEMLTSHLPFEGDSAVSVAIQHISAIPLMPSELNPDIPPGLESITMHAMEPDLNLRYASAEEMLADLEEFRKNPAIRFTYSQNSTVSIASDRHDSGRLRGNDQATREVPSGAIIKAENALPKVSRQPVRSLKQEEYRRQRKNASKTSTLVGVFFIIIFLVGVFVFMWVNFINPWLNPPEEMVTIPKFAGELAENVLNNPDYTAIYRFTEEYRYDETVAEGVIISQDPQADRQQKLPASGIINVKLTISQGPEPIVTMPDLTGKEWRAAVRELDNLDMDLNIQESAETHNTIVQDYVIRTEPEAGETLKKGDTVFIIYSSGPEIKTVKVPDVQGLPLSQAQLRLQGYNLTWDVVYEDNPDVPKGTVTFQDIIPDTEVPEKTEIILTVSNGPVEQSSPPPASSPAQSSPPPETTIDPWGSSEDGWGTP
jgi:serine/threonine-protein kinase